MGIKLSGVNCGNFSQRLFVEKRIFCVFLELVSVSKVLAKAKTFKVFAWTALIPDHFAGDLFVNSDQRWRRMRIVIVSVGRTWKNPVKWRKRRKMKTIPIMAEVQAKSLRSAVKNAKPKKVKNLPKRKRKERQQKVTYQTQKKHHLLPMKMRLRKLLPNQKPKKPKRKHRLLPKAMIHLVLVMFAIILV